MSSGFKFAGQVDWGSNGAIETYVETLAQLAADRFGPDDRLATALREERKFFYTGKVVFLHEILTGPVDRLRFAGLLDAATDEILRDQTFTDYGCRWIDVTIRRLRDRIAAADRSDVSSRS